MNRDRRKSEIGVTLIEFAMVLPFLFVLTFVVIDLSRAFYLKSLITAAARQGARVAAVTPDPAGAGRDSVVARVDRVLSPVVGGGYSMSAPTVTVTVAGAVGDETAKVVVTSTFSWLYLGLFNIFGASGFTNPQALTASSVMRYE